MKKILAVSTSGGHWRQLGRIMPSLPDVKVVYCSTEEKLAGSVPEHQFYHVPQANSTAKLKLMYMLLKVTYVMLRERPDVVISTGAAIGYFALLIGKKFRARTIWVDSLANIEQLSHSGQLVEKHADLWITQWEHLAKPGGPCFFGAVFGSSAKIP